MITRPRDMNAFEFATVASLRAQQLLRGCVGRTGGSHKLTTMAQLEVLEGYVRRAGADEAEADSAADASAVADNDR